jgi:Protein tyrosine and serine/threonine kinase/Leucine rich repeat
VITTLEQLHAGLPAGTRRLKLACGLTEFPREIFDLADTLEVLDLSGNALSSLPEDLPRLSKLRIIFCSDNQFTELPDVLGQCGQLSMVGFKANRIRKVPGRSLPLALRWLILTDNQVESLPPEIGNCTRLQKLMLAGNQLRALPVELSACTRLELLRLAANRLSELPAWLPSLPRLSWLAYAGNPFSDALETTALMHTPIAGIHWKDLELQHQLGEGASGVIYRAEHRTLGNGPQPVAVKLFKGAVTSDGLPHSEMAACITAGEHVNLISVLGKVKDHPVGVNGLVMELIDPQFTNLGGPPSLDSCTRDIYPVDTRFELATALRIAYGIASAARHLHTQGIMHGDLYAHNILHCGEGRALMGDFGAASFYASDNQKLAHSLQRLEVRAFGCLLEELIERCDAPESVQGVMEGLMDLENRCSSEETEDRPLFEEIVCILSVLKDSHQDATTSTRL